MKQVLKDGFEYDCVTGWRKYCGAKPGKWAWIKRKLNKRSRREAKNVIRNLTDYEDVA